MHSLSVFGSRKIIYIYIELDIEALEKARRPMAEEEETEPGVGFQNYGFKLISRSDPCT